MKAEDIENLLKYSTEQEVKEKYQAVTAEANQHQVGTRKVHV